MPQTGNNLIRKAQPPNKCFACPVSTRRNGQKDISSDKYLSACKDGRTPDRSSAYESSTVAIIIIVNLQGVNQKTEIELRVAGG